MLQIWERTNLVDYTLTIKKAYGLGTNIIISGTAEPNPFVWTRQPLWLEYAIGSWATCR